MYKRSEYQVIKNRLEERRKFIQVVMGARQVGKSTVVKQVLKDLKAPYQFFPLTMFRQMFHPAAAFIVGDGGISAKEFLTMDITKLF